MFSNLKEFKKIFRLAFPERPEDKLELLTTKVANVEKTDGKIRECSTIFMINITIISI